MNPFELHFSEWFRQWRGELAATRGCWIVRADRRAGFEHLLEEWSVAEADLLWVSLMGSEAIPVSQLSRVVERPFGGVPPVSPYGNGREVQRWFGRRNAQTSLGAAPLLVISGAHRTDAGWARLRAWREEGVNLLLQVPADYPEDLLQRFEPTRVIEESAFRLDWGAARRLAPASTTDDQLQLHLAAADCFFVPLMNRWRVAADRPPLPEVARWRAAALQGNDIGVLVDNHIVRAVRGGAPVEAFELAVRYRPERAEELVHEVVALYERSGLRERLRGLLASLEEGWLASSEILLRYLFDLSCGTPALPALLPWVTAMLRDREAPELRALHAVRMGVPNLVEETERALRFRETPLTVRMHALALHSRQVDDRALALLDYARELARMAGDGRELHASLGNLAWAAIVRGRYLHALTWAAWGGESVDGQAQSAPAGSVVLRVVRLQAQLLVSDRCHWEVEADALEAALASERGVGRRALHEVLGHVATLRGDLAAALAHHRQRGDHQDPNAAITAALDTIPVLKALAQPDQAQAIGARARALAATRLGVGRVLGDLAHLLALPAERGAAERAQLGRDLVGRFAALGAHYRCAQAAIHAADGYLWLSDVERAQATLHAAREGLRELGCCGWRLLSLGCADPEGLRQLGRGGSMRVYVTLLGTPVVTQQGASSPLGQRAAECIAILALHPEGLSLERLTLLLYGGCGSPSNTKALISRLRARVPIRARPYRLEASLKVDLWDLMDALRRGDSAGALALYTGPLLPQSECEPVVETRGHIEESLRHTVIASASAAVLLTLADRLEEGDLELLELAESLLPPDDPQSHDLRVRVRRLRRDWGLG
jgi:hypothetical protein